MTYALWIAGLENPIVSGDLTYCNEFKTRLVESGQSDERDFDIKLMTPYDTVVLPKDLSRLTRKAIA